jgi:acid phosphatase
MRTNWTKRGLIAALLIVASTGPLQAQTKTPAKAPACPAMPKVNLPPPAALPLNIDHVKKQLRDYQKGAYRNDVAAVFKLARTFVETRAPQVTKPAIVLDIDETSLSNWDNISANDFGFINRGTCDLPDGPCGFKSWIAQSQAKVIEPARDLVNAAVAKGVAVFFITGRHNGEWDATFRNLVEAKLEGWTRLITRPDYDLGSPKRFKTAERAKLVAEGYTIVANVGDQDSDLDGGHFECRFKVPNPFYFIE